MYVRLETKDRIIVIKRATSFRIKREYVRIEYEVINFKTTELTKKVKEFTKQDIKEMYIE